MIHWTRLRLMMALMTRKNDPMLSLEPACLPYLRQPVVAGLSGGRDSVALLLLLEQQGCPVHACHVHHGIRGAEADADAAFCRQLCQQRRIPFHCAYVDVPALAKESGQSLETAARLARRRVLADAARRAGGRAVALAHHADDQAETVLFRLARGAAGARGMRAVHEAEGILWLRPLLSCTRAQLTLWLEGQGQGWKEDSTNAVPDVARNRIRLEVLPALDKALGRRVAPILNRSARLQEETNDALDAALQLLESSYTDPQGRLYLPFIKQQSPTLRKAIIHRYLSLHRVPGITEATIGQLDGILMSTSPPSRLNLPGGSQAVRAHRRLFLS